MSLNCGRIACLVLLSSALAALPLAAASAAENGATVFRIGTFDRSSAEFSQESPTGSVNFIVSQSSAAKDWYAAQPAVLAVKPQPAGPAAAPRTITFTLANAPAAAYRLRIALLIESASVPALKVQINGKSGFFYLHPQHNYDSGDQVDSFDPAYAAADVDFTFPGAYLHAGANTIALEPVEEASEAVPDAAINYDALELTAAAAAPAAGLQQAELVPTVFYVQHGAELAECVEAYIRYGQRTQPGGSAELTLSGKHYRQALTGGRDFGEEKLEFQVAEFAPHSDARLSLKINGRAERYQQSIDPAKKWTLYLVPHIHVDVGYSDYQAKVAAIQSRTVDEAMQMMADHPEFRFSLDGEWDLEQFLESRSPARQQRAIEALQQKRMFLPAQYANLLTGIPTAETLIRSLYPSAALSRKYGLPLDYANITDVPTYSWSYASILASAGIHYLAAGGNNYRAPVLMQGRLNETSPVWWVGPDNQRVLLWYSRHYMQMQFLFGLPPLVPAGRELLPIFLQMYERPTYRANAAIIYGTQVENTDLFPQQAELVQKWSKVYAYPRLQYSGIHEAMASIQQQFGDNIPTIRGDGGPYWEDGAAADARYLAMERGTEARAQTAEKLATLAPFLNPNLHTNTAELARLWTTMVLMDEHTWDSYNSVTDPASREAIDQLALKDQLAVNAAAQTDFVTRRGMANLADAVPAGTGSVIVFNSLNWKRSGTVALDLDKGQELVDVATGQPVPSEILGGGANFQHLRFLAKDVPALGYKVYATRKAAPSAAPPAAVQAAVLESPYYKVQLDAETGSIHSIYDKQLQRELVSQQGPYRFGQYLYVTGGDNSPNTILRYGPMNPQPALEIHAAHGGKIVSVTQTPFGQVAHLESQAVNAPSIKTEIRLFDGEKKIEIVEDLDKTEVLTREAAYFAFPFDMKQPQFQYEVQNGVVDPAQDMYPGAGHEWFTAQHWVSAQQDGLSATVMPLDAPLVTLGDINRGAWPSEFGKRPGTVFSYVMNNYWDTNYPAGQGGRFTFHYVVTSADATHPTALSRLGWEQVTPLEQDYITTQDKALGPAQPGSTQAAAAAPHLDASQQSFLDMDDPNLLVETWKPAEDGEGTILRFLDLGGAERTAIVRTPLLKLDHIARTDSLERGGEPVTMTARDQFQFTVHPHEIVTLRLVEAAQ
jgi:hypothetical protein